MGQKRKALGAPLTRAAPVLGGDPEPRYGQCAGEAWISASREPICDGKPSS